MFSTLIYLLASALLSAAALSPIHRTGSFLFDDSGDRFYVKGVAYAANYGSSETPVSPGSISALDPLANTAGCKRDIPFFQQLGINVIRVYQANASLDHSECMSALDAAGIYVFLDLATPAPNDAISTSAPGWNVGLLTNFISTVDAFSGFSNVIGFNVGNEVISSQVDDQAAPYIKAAARDIKAYITAHGLKQLVGYTATDSPNSRVTLAEYLACNSTETSIDYWGLNIYEWCGNSTFEASGYQARTQELAGLNIPAFFSEFGCNQVSPRAFQDVPTLFSSQMSDVWSGGIIFEYIQESNDFGLVTISSDGQTVTTLTDFDNLKAQYAGVSPPSLSESSYKANTTLPACPATDPTNWPASQSIPPTPNNDVCTCVTNQLACTSTFNEATDLGTIGTAVGTVCGISSEACAVVAGNGTTGVYGALAFCDPLQVLNIAIGTYYELQGHAADACDFNGMATLSASGKPDSTQAVASATSSCLGAGFAAGTGIPSASAEPAGVTTQPLVSGASTTSSGHKSAAVELVAPRAAAMFLGSLAIAFLSAAAV